MSYSKEFIYTRLTSPFSSFNDPDMPIKAGKSFVEGSSPTKYRIRVFPVPSLAINIVSKSSQSKEEGSN
jgi:hypothetical protein